SITTPLPMIDNLPSRTTPDGSNDSLYVEPLITRVCPALWPPWKRTTVSACSDSQSTILPLPSSPHGAPPTTTFAIDVKPLEMKNPGARPGFGCGRNLAPSH